MKESEMINGKDKRDQFNSRLGFVLATAGSAVGLGNIWRFPYMVGENGGGAFLFVYIGILFLIGVSLLLLEFVIGRNGGTNAIDSYIKINKKSKWVGWLGFFSAFIFLSYYSVIGGWTLYFTMSSLTGAIMQVAPGEMGQFFSGFISSPVTPLIFHLVFMMLTVGIVLGGVSGGIEKYSKILMPLLFLAMILFAIRSVTLDGAWEGIKWYLTPDISKITPKTIAAAMGQVFFSLSVGMSGMVTYASYLSKKENLTVAASQVALADTFVAILAGLMIFPVLFSAGFEPGQGVGLIFITMPIIFSQMPFGALFGFLFFSLLAVAALTSAISILEMPVSYLTERKNVDRKNATFLVGGISYVLGAFVSLGFGIWSSFKVFGLDIFGIFDFFGSNISLPLGALGAAITVGWMWNKKDALNELTNNGEVSLGIANIWFAIVRYVVPIAIAIVFLMNIGIIK